MTIPPAEVTVPAVAAGISLTMFLGHDATFWLIVLSATTMKMMFSEPVNGAQGWRQFTLSLLAAILTPFAATKAIAELLEIKSLPVEYLIAFLLVIAGEGLIRGVIRVSNDPSGLLKFLRAWRGMK